MKRCFGLDPLVTLGLRERSRGEFENFLLEAAAGELYLIENVLEQRNARSAHAGAELPLADAFAIELGRDEAYFKVPEELRGEVTALVENRLSKGRK